MCRLTCCPSLTLQTFTAIITIVHVAMFIITLSWKGIMIPSTDFLTPNFETLDVFGNRNTYLLRDKYQIWRFLTPVFLHANFLHLFFNVISQLMIGSQVEKVIGTGKMVIVYFMCAIGGNLFGALTSDALAVGASTAISGLLGCFIGFIIVNWHRIDPNTRCFMICMVSFIIIINILFGAGGQGGSVRTNQVDTSGHLGGLISGVLVGMALIRPMGGVFGGFETKVKNIGYILSFAYFIGCAVLFYVA